MRAMTKTMQEDNKVKEKELKEGHDQRKTDNNQNKMTVNNQNP